MGDRMMSRPIAIVGLAGRFPSVADLEDFWRQLRDGAEALEEFDDVQMAAAGVPPSLRNSAGYVRRGTVLEDADCFDAAFFGVSPREAQLIDPQHRIFLECAWEAVEHAGYAGDLAQRTVGVYASSGMNTYLLSQIMRNAALIESVGGYQIMVGNDKDFLCTRVSYKLGLRGPSMSIQTACSSSLVAVVAACRALQQGDCDMALAGGVSVSFPQRAGYLYQEGMILSPDGHCRPFDVDARGTRSGAGAGIVVLKRLDDALKDGDTVHAVIRGGAVNNDGAAKAGYTAPGIDGQVAVILMAQALAQVDPRSIGYIEAHGTGTPLGDPIEIAALTRAFRASTPDVGFCRLGSLKANLGHLDAAAGVAGLIKTVLALQHRELPPLTNFRSPNPQLGLPDSPFTASARGATWTSDAGTPRRAGVSSFGIGGTNAHVVLEEAPSAAKVRPGRDAHLLILSARTAAALEQASARLADHLERHVDQPLACVEWTLQAGRENFSYRRALVAGSHGEAAAALRGPRQAPLLDGLHEGGARPVAFLFSGQGSQYAGMGAGLYRSEAAYREAVDACSLILQPLLGLDIRGLLLAGGGDGAIDQTRLAQPALFVTEYALASLWMRWGVRPQAMIGHSIGEYVAAHLAGVLSLEDALRVVAERGRLMQALPPGAMAAVHLRPEELAGWLGDGIELAAVNAPELCAVAGPRPSVAKLLLRLQAAGIDARALQTSHAFHSSMMETAVAPFAAVMETVRLSPPSIPYVSNLSGTWITPQQAVSPTYYAAHLRQVVQFEAGLKTLDSEASLFHLEVGPGGALTTLARLTLGVAVTRRASQSLPPAHDRRSDVAAILEAAGRLWLAGAPPAWRAVQAGSVLRRVPLPTYPFERKRHWVEAAGPDRGAGTSAPAAPLAQAGRAVDDWFHAPTWTRDDGQTGLALCPQDCWLLLADKGALTERLVAGLLSCGANPVLVERGTEFRRLGTSDFSVRPDKAEDYAAVAAALAGARIAGVVHLWHLAAVPPESARESGEGAYRELVAMGCALAPAAGDPAIQVLHVTRGSHSVLDEPVAHHCRALAWGPVLVLPAELPGLRMRSVDVEWDDGPSACESLAGILLQEAACLDGEAFVARRAGRRWVRRFERIALPPLGTEELPLKQGGVYLITGGLGGIGLALARWLAASVRARLLLTARTPLPTRESWDEWLRRHPPTERNATCIAAVREIESGGGEVQIACADAADDAAMAAAVDSVRARWGRIDGVVHAAGIAGAGQIALRQGFDDAQAVFAAKARGIEVLLRVLGDTELDFVALMSSINAVVGAPGACDYASANAVLDAFADSAACPPGWRRVVSMNWGAWRDVGMAANLAMPQARRQQWQAHLESAIPPAAGVEAFARVIGSGRRRVVIAPYDLPMLEEQARCRDRATPRRAISDAAADANASQVQAHCAPPVAPPRFSADEVDGTSSERSIAAIWTELLGVDAVGLHDNFFELGGHSLLATRVLARVHESLGASLTLRDVFEAPTVHGLAQRIADKMPASPVAKQIADEDREEIEF